MYSSEPEHALFVSQSLVNQIRCQSIGPIIYLLQYAVGCRACLFVCSDLLAVSEFVFSLLWFL